MAIWKKHQCSLAQKVGPGNTVPLQKLGGPWPLRNWNNFFPLIELHCVSSQHCIGLSNSLSAPHQKKRGSRKRRPVHTSHTPTSDPQVSSAMHPNTAPPTPFIHFPVWFHHRAKPKRHSQVVRNTARYTSKSFCVAKQTHADLLKPSEIPKSIRI